MSHTILEKKLILTPEFTPKINPQICIRIFTL